MGRPAKAKKKADKLERVARNSPSSRNTVQANDARDAATSAKNKNQGAESVTTGTAEAAGQKKADKVKFSLNNNAGSVPMPLINGQFVDNVGKKPIILPVQR